MDSIWYHVNWPTSSTESLSRTFSMKSCVSSPMLSEFEARRSVNLFECSEYRSSIDLRALLNPCNSYPFVTAFSYHKNIELVSETMVYRQNKRPCIFLGGQQMRYIHKGGVEWIPTFLLGMDLTNGWLFPVWASCEYMSSPCDCVCVCKWVLSLLPYSSWLAS